MTLVIQSNIPGQLVVWLLLPRPGKFAHRQVGIRPGGSQALLSVIDALLRSRRQNLRAVTGIVVVRGPGPFTPVRTGLVVANTLGFVLGVPVVGVVADHVLSEAECGQYQKRLYRQKAGRYARPAYGREPNITRPTRTPLAALRRRAGRGRGRTVAKSTPKRRTTS